MCSVTVSGNSIAKIENAEIKNNDKGLNKTPAIIKIPALTSTKAITKVKASGCTDNMGN